VVQAALGAWRFLRVPVVVWLTKALSQVALVAMPARAQFLVTQKIILMAELPVLPVLAVPQSLIRTPHWSAIRAQSSVVMAVQVGMVAPHPTPIQLEEVAQGPQGVQAGMRLIRKPV
jgi:hypothetical protein